MSRKHQCRIQLAASEPVAYCVFVRNFEVKYLGNQRS